MKYEQSIWHSALEFKRNAKLWYIIKIIEYTNCILISYNYVIERENQQLVEWNWIVKNFQKYHIHGVSKIFVSLASKQHLWFRFGLNSLRCKTNKISLTYCISEAAKNNRPRYWHFFHRLQSSKQKRNLQRYQNEINTALAHKNTGSSVAAAKCCLNQCARRVKEC